MYIPENDCTMDRVEPRSSTLCLLDSKFVMRLHYQARK